MCGARASSGESAGSAPMTPSAAVAARVSIANQERTAMFNRRPASRSSGKSARR